jgi:hypothetical protein
MSENAFSVDGQVCFHDLVYKGYWLKGGEGFEGHPQVRQIPFSGQVGLEQKSTALRHGSNSGYAAINLAFLFGAEKIILLGYDMKCEGEQRHWHARPDGWGAEYFNNVLQHEFLPLFDFLIKPLESAGVTVINATPNSALTCWPRMALEQALSFTRREKGVLQHDAHAS